MMDLISPILQTVYAPDTNKGSKPDIEPVD